MASYSNISCVNYVARSTSYWRDDSAPSDRIMQGWQGSSYGQTHTAITVMTFNVPANEIVDSLSFTFMPSGGFDNPDKSLKIVRPPASAPKIFNASSGPSVYYPSSENLLQSTTFYTGQQCTVTANDAVLSYLAEGYNYILICNFESEPWYSDYSWSRDYNNSTGATYSYSTSASGKVRIYTGSGGENGWVYATPYIYTGTGPHNGWVQAIPYVYTGSGGQNGWNIAK